MPNLFRNNGRITIDDSGIVMNYMANTANTASDTIRGWVTNTHNEWNQIRESITYRDAEVWSRESLRRAQPDWSEVFQAFELDSSEDKNEDIEEENELLDEFLSEFAVKGDGNK